MKVKSYNTEWNDEKKQGTWMKIVDKLEGESRTNPPFRNDQHPLLAETVPMQTNASFSPCRLALIIAEFEPWTLTHTVKKWCLEIIIYIFANHQHSVVV